MRCYERQMAEFRLKAKKFHFKAIIGVYSRDETKQNLPRVKNAANARSKLLSIQKSTASMLFKQTRREWVYMFGKANILCTYAFILETHK